MPFVAQLLTIFQMCLGVSTVRGNGFHVLLCLRIFWRLCLKDRFLGPIHRGSDAAGLSDLRISISIPDAGHFGTHILREIDVRCGER